MSSSSVDKTIEVDTTLNYVLRLRVYGYRSDSSVSHSYLVDDLPTGCNYCNSTSSFYILTIHAILVFVL